MTSSILKKASLNLSLNQNSSLFFTISKSCGDKTFLFNIVSISVKSADAIFIISEKLGESVKFLISASSFSLLLSNLSTFSVFFIDCSKAINLLRLAISSFFL